MRLIAVMVGALFSALTASPATPKPPIPTIFVAPVPAAPSLPPTMLPALDERG